MNWSFAKWAAGDGSHAESYGFWPEYSVTPYALRTKDFLNVMANRADQIQADLIAVLGGTATPKQRGLCRNVAECITNLEDMERQLYSQRNATKPDRKFEEVYCSELQRSERLFKDLGVDCTFRHGEPDQPIIRDYYERHDNKEFLWNCGHAPRAFATCLNLFTSEPI